MLTLLIIVIVTALIFDFINNFIGAIMGTAVAKTIAGDFTDAVLVTQTVVLSALVGAIVWNLIT